jgi:WD40 repeat protein
MTTAGPGTDHPDPLAGVSTASYTYDAFLSYSRHDAAVAEGIQKGLHRIARRTGRLHALRVFRDKTDLTASPSLLGKITDALDRSRYLIVVLSPHAAASEWVNKEVEYWLEHRGPEQILLALADGQLQWEDETRRFDPDRSTAIVPVLRESGVLATEPIYVDVSGDSPWDFDEPRFRDRVTELAAPIHGKSKYDLASDDKREQHRFRRLRQAAIAGLVLLTVLAVVGGVLAFVQRQEAVRQRDQAEQRYREAVGAKLVSQAQGLLTSHPGSEVRAFQLLLAGNALAADYDALYGTVVKSRDKRKIVETERISHLTRDGKHLLTVDDGQVWRLCDAETGRPMGQPVKLPGQQWTLSSNGRLVAAVTEGGLTIWDLMTGKPVIGPVGSRADFAGTSEFSEDAKTLVSVSYDGILRVWDTHSGREIRRGILAGPWWARSGKDKEDLSELQLSSDGRRLVGTVGHDVETWDTGTGQTVGAPFSPAEGGFLWGVTLNGDGSRAVVVDQYDDKFTVRVWDTITGAPVTDPITSGRVGEIAWNADGTLFVYDTVDDYKIHLVRAASGTPIGAPLSGHTVSVSNLGFVERTNLVISSSNDATARIWDFDADLPTVALAKDKGGYEEAYASVLTRDGSRLMMFYCHHDYEDNDKQCGIGIWDTATGQKIRTLPTANGDDFFDLAVSGDGRRLLAVRYQQDRSRPSVSELWNLDSEQPTGTLVPLNAETFGAPILDWDGHLAAVATANTVQVLDTKVHNVIATVPKHLTPVAFSPDGRLITGYRDGYIQIWDPSKGVPLTTAIPGQADAIYAAVFAADGRRFATASQDNTAQVWDLDPLKTSGAPLKWQSQPVNSVAFSPDGRMLVSGSSDGTVVLWDLDTRRVIGDPLTGFSTNAASHFSGVTDVAFSADGRRIVAASSHDGILRSWPATATPEDLCDKITTNMSHKQWHEWVSPDIDYIKVCPDLPIAPD